MAVVTEPEDERVEEEQAVRAQLDVAPAAPPRSSIFGSFETAIALTCGTKGYQL